MFLRSTLEIDLNNMAHLCDPFVWYNYQTSAIVSLPARISSFIEENRVTGSKLYLAVTAQIKTAAV